MSDFPFKPVEHVIGRFRILQILGRGSEGVVYLAHDPELGRDVAIKTTFRYETPDPAMGALLLSTAQTASKLSHPNIVPVFETGMHEGLPYVVFEYVAGRTLLQLLNANGPMAMASAVVMMSQILAGVALIHERSLIHGDIKPANILIGANDRAQVADFGLLRHEHATNIDHTSGTLRYKGPECFDGRPTDCRRDVYALGLLFYEMLTGEAVVTKLEDAAAMVLRIFNDIPSPPSAKNPRIAPEIDAIVMKALRKIPAQRFANAGEMKRELDRIRVADSSRVEVGETIMHGTAEFLLRRMAHKSDFSALSASVTSINQLSAEAETASIKALSDTVMRDFALTQKLLRLVNSAAMGVGNVTKVSDAIAILGVGQLRAMATAMMLANAGGGKNTPAITAALTDAFVAGLISRNVGRLSGLDAVEELFICGMFSPLGELLTIYYLAEEYGEIARRVCEDGAQGDAAARAVLGISFEELGIAVARHWQFPPAFVTALTPLPPGELGYAREPADRMWQCAGYARELCTLVRINDVAARGAALAAHIKRFKKSIPIDLATVHELMRRSIEVAGNYTAAAGFAAAKTAVLMGMSELCTVDVCVVASPEELSAVAEEKTILVSRTPPGWRSRIAQALRAVL